MRLSPAEIMAVLESGDAAAELLRQPAFHTTIDYLSNYHLSALVAAPIGAPGLEAREHHHTMHTALREIAQDLTSRVGAAEELRARLEMLDQEDEAE